MYTTTLPQAVGIYENINTLSRKNLLIKKVYLYKNNFTEKSYLMIKPKL